ncbi:hypothetical protein LAUMK191_02530 [Mycobacterium attenuatum]|uniref:Uncharacterized protein n=1 Tax=Mycobacterium attenuatum TaxID=2341086 RepID=A0A498Q2G2_9MYCO|nr:hypothetical protein LAUMK136_02526 [Mycobacterium attenuatum]VBA52611.1 hypothetical protein LAUMK191_02530 [Mycobacterium attenuatum]VBA57709.1 hypothetical protein LAUMK41_02615 [Mycobacterium attenuatum]
MIGMWLALNPVVFGKPKYHRAWATRAMLGEELWVTERPPDAAMLVSAVASAVSLCAVFAARRRRLKPAVVATALQMTLTMVYWNQMVRYLDRRRGGDTQPQ